MPQGGIDPAEDIIAAARRELLEETGVTEAEFLAVTDEWWAYDFPLPYTPTGHGWRPFAASSSAGRHSGLQVRKVPST